jgi:hypothetical protein
MALTILRKPRSGCLEGRTTLIQPNRRFPVAGGVVAIPLLFLCEPRKIPLLLEKIPLLQRAAEFLLNTLILLPLFTKNRALSEARS